MKQGAGLSAHVSASHLRAPCPRRSAPGSRRLLIWQSPKSTTRRCASQWARPSARSQRLSAQNERGFFALLLLLALGFALSLLLFVCANRFYPKTQLSWLGARLDCSHYPHFAAFCVPRRPALMQMLSRFENNTGRHRMASKPLLLTLLCIILHPFFLLILCGCR